jgi:pimeloyl-ACP methyl ester carboxylesterase
MSILDQLVNFPLQTTATERGQVSFRSSGNATKITHVLLHGIGSGSASWFGQLGAAHSLASHRLLAWDAPGYGQSTPLQPVEPRAHDYAKVMWDWLDRQHHAAPVTLVGHSLGALMAAAACCLAPDRVAGLVLLAPAQGYGQAPPSEREKKLQDRLATLNRLGPQGLAEQRSAAMLSEQAPARLQAMVRANMAAIHPEGYTQASRMLANGQLLRDLAACPVGIPIVVASGAADTITTPSACQAVAAAAHVSWINLGPAGHACPLEAVLQVNALLGLPEYPL